MVMIGEIRELKKQGKNREIIAAVDAENIDFTKRPRIEVNDEKLLEKAWAHHQLGEYDKSLQIMWDLSEYYPASSVIGESALRGFAHGRLQKDMDIEAADAILRRLPQGLTTDNVRMNQIIMAVRKGLTIPAGSVMSMITNALETVPYATINGHIVNNGALALYEARQQEVTKPYLPVLPGLIEAAISIYEATNTPKNHIAGAMFRASQIFEAADWKRGAILVAEESVAIWRELVSMQDGARYQRNLEGAEAQLKKVTS